MESLSDLANSLLKESRRKIKTNPEAPMVKPYRLPDIRIITEKIPINTGERRRARRKPYVFISLLYRKVLTITVKTVKVPMNAPRKEARFSGSG